MALENGLYAQVFMIHRRESDNKKEIWDKKYKFQGQSARKKHWLDLDHKWLQEYFMTHEPDFYKNYIKLNLGVIIQKNIKCLEHQLVMQRWQKSTVPPKSTTDTLSPKVIY